MGYPVHSYGSDQVLNAWRNTQQNKQMRDDSITRAILQGVSTGAVEAPEGSPVYKGLSKRFGPQFVKGVSEKGAQIRQNQQLEYAVNNFNLGMKYFETASKLQSQMGPERANPMIKQWTPKINEHFKQAGLDINVSEMFTAQRNKELIREGLATKLQQVTENAVNNPTWANYNQAVTAYNAVYGQKGIMDGTTKDAMDLGMKSLDTVKDRLMKQEEEAKQSRLIDKRYGNQVQLANMRKGTEFTVSPDGTVKYTQGGPAGGQQVPLTKGATTNMQKDMVTIGDTISRLDEVARLYKPEYQKYETRWGMGLRNLRSKAAGIAGIKDLSVTERQELQNYGTYRKTAVGGFSKAINDLAGATLSKNEEKLYGGGLPNPGTGMFDGDSPPVFEAALNATRSNLMKSFARRQHLINIGYTMPEIKGQLHGNTVMSMAKFEGIVRDKAKQFEIQVAQSKPDASKSTIKDEVVKLLKAEFGIGLFVK